MSEIGKTWSDFTRRNSGAMFYFSLELTVHNWQKLSLFWLCTEIKYKFPPLQPFFWGAVSLNLTFLFHYSQYLNLVKSMPSSSHVGRTKLDKERLKLCQYEVESVCQSAQELKGSTRDDGHIKDNLKAANALLQRLLNIAIEVCCFVLH